MCFPEDVYNRQNKVYKTILAPSDSKTKPANNKEDPFFLVQQV